MSDPKNEKKEPTVAEAILALADKIKPQGPLEQAGLSPERIAEITRAPTPRRWRLIAIRSEETGATAIAEVEEHPTKKNGVIRRLREYRHPPEAYVYESDGGRVPNGFPMWAGPHPVSIAEGKEPTQGDLSPLFLQWRFVEFYKRDLERLIPGGGKVVEIQPHHCQNPDALKATPWADGKVGAA